MTQKPVIEGGNKQFFEGWKQVMSLNFQRPIHGLYAITPDISDSIALQNKIRFALQGGTQILQYRNKSASSILRLQQAQALRLLTRKFAVTYIVNDDVKLAAQVDADGVHLGTNDGSIAGARAILGSGKLIGVSCYNRRELAQAAIASGADYVAFGAFFLSGVKPDAVRADPELLAWAKKELAVPLVAIGGITQANGAALVQAGADALAVISAVFDAADIQSAAQEFTTLINKVQHDISQSNAI